MKKYILALLFVPLWTFAQTATENYIKNTSYNIPYNGDIENYPATLIGNNTSFFTCPGGTSSGGADGTISIINNILNVNFSGSWSTTCRLHLGEITPINSTPALPDTELGAITQTGAVQTGYFARIRNGALYFYSSYYLKGVSSNLTVPYSSSLNYTTAIGSIHNCISGGVGASGGTFTITNTQVSLTLGGGWSDLCNIKTGDIFTLTSTPVIASLELGAIKSEIGDETVYHARIVNNVIQIYATTEIPSTPLSAVDTELVHDFGISDDNKIVSITYVDGLGRPKQSIAVKAGGNGEDIITPIVYDEFGRQTRQYLPYADPAQTVSSQEYRDNVTLVNTTLPNRYLQKFPNDLIATANNPYSETFYEASPLNRILKQAAPGSSWMGSATDNNDNTLKSAYDTNTSDGSLFADVKKLRVTTVLNSNGVYEPTFVDDGIYPAGELFKTIIKDENDPSEIYHSNSLSSNFHTTHEYKNKDGQVVLKRTFYNTTDSFGTPQYGALNTYYVYDDFGKLTYVLPPKANGALIADLCYQYKYDERNRLIEKKLPGKQWEYIVYDKLDRVVATGPANPPFSNLSNNGWCITKYDKFNRIVLTGWMSSSATITSSIRKARQDEWNAATVFNESRDATTTDVTISGVAFRYSNTALPTSGYHVLTVNYYDDYTYPSPPDIPATIEGQPVYYNNTTKPMGLPTGNWVRAISTSTSYRYELAYNLYDKNGRVIRAFIKNHENLPSGSTQIDTKLDFLGKPLYTITQHKRTNAGDVTIVRENFTYSPQQRLLIQTHKVTYNGIDKPEQLLASYIYDELGQLTSKNLGSTNSTTSFQTVDYNYNIRGWLRGINDVGSLSHPAQPTDLFAHGMSYNTVTPDTEYSGNSPFFNGNISETYWRTAGDNVLRKYSYTYDYTNRLTKAVYQKPGADNPMPDAYNEILRYDTNGNILSLVRSGNIDGTAATQIDNLTYTYATNSNQLIKVSDAATTLGGFNDGVNSGDDYAYDNYGNFTQDLNKGIATGGIKYNHLNLPIQVTLPNGTITYMYDALGKKLEKVVTTTGVGAVTTKYLEGFQYNNTSGSDVLQFFPMSEGYVSRASGNIFSYVYNYRDHSGNVRLSYTDSNKDGIIEDTQNYREGFESQTGWGASESNVGTLTYETSNPHSGNYCAKIVNTGTSENYAHSDYEMRINNLNVTSYTVSGWVRGTGSFAEVHLLQKTDTETDYATTVATVYGATTVTGWTSFTATASVGPNIKKLILRIDNNGGGTVWFDDIQLKKTNINSEIVEESNYYAFGLKHTGYGYPTNGLGSADAQKYKYNGKELQDELGLNIYDYGARNYDPSIGKWMNIDPLAEASRQSSPYTYCHNDPIYFVDPNGMLAEGQTDFYRPHDTNTVIWLDATGEIPGYEHLPNYNPSAGVLPEMIIGDIPSHYSWSDFKDDWRRFANRSDRWAESWGPGMGLAIANMHPVVALMNANKVHNEGTNIIGEKTSKGQANFEVAMSMLPLLKVGKLAPLLETAAPEAEVVESVAVKEGANLIKFAGDEAVNHFSKHAKSIMNALGKTSYNLKNYVDDANYIIKNGTFVPELNGYVRLIGGQGSAKFGFVGINRVTGEITTFHIKTAKELAAKVPTMFGY